MLPDTRRQTTGLALRNANMLTVPNNRTALYQRSFVPKTTRDWNLLPEPIRSDPCLKTFKKAIVSQFSAETPKKFNTIGTKMGNILHTRLRLNSTRLNAHLFQIQKSSSPSCECGNPSENVTHFVLNCPRFDTQRSELYYQVTRIVPGFLRLTDSYKLKILLHGYNLNDNDGVKVAKLFQTFLISTKRFLP